LEIASILIVFIIISIIISFGIGANDETMSVIYGSRMLTIKQILVLTTILAISGAFLLGRAVSNTVGKEILRIEITHAIVITILLSTAIWLILSSSYGLPISTTHATIGAIIGIGLTLGGMNGLNWLTIFQMVIWWILSPIMGFFASFFAYKLLQIHKERNLKGFLDYEKNEKIFAYILLITISFTAFSRAGNDCSNAVGIVLGIGDVDVNLLLLITGLSFASGIIVLGRLVIKNLGSITELRPSTAFTVEVPNSIILFIGTLQGIPLSGTHMLVASLLGLSKASKTPMEKGIWKIILVWILTFPMAAIFSVVLFFPIDYILSLI